MKLTVTAFFSIFCFLSAGSLFAMDQTEPSARKIQTYSDCAIQCERCAAACLNHHEGFHGEHAPICIKLCRDSSDICAFAAKLTARGSELASQLDPIVQQACQACAEECGKNVDDENCMRCAEACLRCVKESSADQKKLPRQSTQN